MTTTLLDIYNVKKTFLKGTINENYVLRDLSLTIRKGDFISVIGGNGSGKSTLLNAIAGTLTVDTGYIKLDNKDITKLSEEKRAKYISRVHQDPMLGTAPRMTVAENLSIALKRGEKRGFRKTLSVDNYALFGQVLSQLGLNLENKLDTDVELLSGGQRQVIALLMATIKKPKLLLLDEHTAALDPKATEQVMRVTDQRINENNITSLMITHNMQHAIDYGNRLIMMDEGRVVLDISGEDKKELTVAKLIKLFNNREKTSSIFSDNLLLS